MVYDCNALERRSPNKLSLRNENNHISLGDLINYIFVLQQNSDRNSNTQVTLLLFFVVPADTTELHRLPATSPWWRSLSGLLVNSV
uniref:Uncharacterized protein n=1 Tax=Trichobilharzia regenti TaxID=157069 RepID=A0AA85KCV7_TRIRE|nr:unnamed protein product [Trichobilharzia regenti]